MTLVLQEARVGKDTITKVVKSVVEKLTLEGVDLGLTWEVLVQ